MLLITDKQTLDDLNIIGRRGQISIFEIFNRTHTRGGAELLEQMFRYPLSDKKAINERSGIIHYFADNIISFPFSPDLFDSAEQYLGNTDERSRLVKDENTVGRKLNALLGSDTEYQQIIKGIQSVIAIISQLYDLCPRLRAGYGIHMDNVEQVLLQQDIKILIGVKDISKIGFDDAVAYDKIIRFANREQVSRIMDFVYLLDVYLSVALVAKQKGFAFAEAMEPESHFLEIADLYHPVLTNPVSNTVKMNNQSNIMFLTGANMAGKSTFMKSMGIAVFLAHAGFPVPASSMKFSVFDALLTTINLPDDLNSGYSHYYTEVLRVKKIASLLKNSKNMFVIFDELFRGTNVKDAYEATFTIMAAFATQSNCMFTVSTHIIEVGEKLKKECSNIQFNYLPTTMKGTEPVYTYRLHQGISPDRHGMLIIENEGILDILENGLKLHQS